MFCTEKERKTCNVEKMGCEGCYYNENYLETKEAYELYFRGNPRLEKEVKKLISTVKELESNLYSANCIISEQIDIIRDSIPKSKVINKVIEIKNRPVKDNFITATQGKLDTIIAIEELLER